MYLTAMDVTFLGVGWVGRGVNPKGEDNLLAFFCAKKIAQIIGQHCVGALQGSPGFHKR